MQTITGTPPMTDRELFSEISFRIRKYRQRDDAHVAAILFTSVIPFLVLITLSYFLYDLSKWYSVLISIPAIFFYVRMFAVLHDCAHGTFFRDRTFNNLLGHFIGLFFYTPFLMWQDGHHKHHVNSGNLDKRNENPDVWLMTEKEFAATPAPTKMAYRLFRSPYVYLTIVPLALFLLLFRVPSKWFSSKINCNIIILNVVIVAAWFLAYHTIGLEKFIWMQWPVCVPGFAVGAFMFYLQHQFEGSYYSHDEDFVFEIASLKGSSFYRFPGLLNWMTGNVAYHHVHHLNPGIPMYNLVAAHEEIIKLYPVQALTLREGLRSFRLKLWDEEHQKMVPFS